MEGEGNEGAAMKGRFCERGRHEGTQPPPVNKHAVRILLECFLVFIRFVVAAVVFWLSPSFFITVIRWTATFNAVITEEGVSEAVFTLY